MKTLRAEGVATSRSMVTTGIPFETALCDTLVSEAEMGLRMIPLAPAAMASFTWLISVEDELLALTILMVRSGYSLAVARTPSAMGAK